MSDTVRDAHLAVLAAEGLGEVIVRLLKGVVFREDSADLWAKLTSWQAYVEDYVAIMGLGLYIDEAEGYAFLRLRGGEDADDADVPKLVARRPLSYPVSLLLALLRKRLAEFDASGADTRLVLSRDDIAELIRVFLPESSNEARFMDRLDAHLNRAAELGFVRPLRGQDHMYEVRRIIKAFVDAQWLHEFEEKLAVYRAHAMGQGGADADE